MPRPFQLLVKPVGPRCNLACRYCFYSGELEPDTSLPAVMPGEVLETMIRKFLALRQPQSVICWQGGEPTLAGLDFFRRVVELEKKHGQGGQVVANALQTNGQLIDEDWAALLAEYHFLVGLSIDGPAEIHDAERRDRRGGGSLAQAMRAAEIMQRRGVEFNILSVVHAGNQERGREVFQWLVAQGWRYLQFIPCVEADAAGRPAPQAVTPQGYGQFLCDVWQAYRESGRRDISLRTYEAWLSQKVLGESTLCTFSEQCGDYLLVKPDGSLYPCDFFFEPEWRLGNLMTDDLLKVMTETREARFGGLKGDLAAECRGCNRLSLCHGGCPKDRLVAAGGRSGPQRSYLCESYRTFMDRCEPDLDQVAGEISRRFAEERRRSAAPADLGRAGRSGRPGRNEPCPCGSGRKFKNCCGRG